MAKLVKILEAMDSFRIDSDVALLENEGLDDLTRAQTKKILHESFGFIKTQLIQGGILEDTQAMLAGHWTQAIMEDIDLGNQVPEDDGMGAELAGAGLAAGGIAAGARYAPAAATAYNQYRQQDQSVGDSLKAAGANIASGVTGDVNAARNMAGQAVAAGSRAVHNAALKADIVGRNAVGQAGQAISNTVMPVAGKVAGAAGLAAGSALGKVKRAFGK